MYIKLIFLKLIVLKNKTMIISTSTFTLLSNLFTYTSNYGHGNMINRFSNFTEFAIKYNKSYLDIKSVITAFDNYNTNLNFINNHDEDLNGYQLGETQFMDMSSTEFNNHKGCSLSKSTSCVKFDQNNITDDPKEQVDWRENNVVTPVKDQKSCGSCWSFSATGALEGAWAIKKNELISFSEQQLLDCSGDYGNHGCNGGLPDRAFEYVMDNGICTEDQVPYSASEQSCQTCSSSSDNKIDHCVDVTPLNQNDLKLAVSNGPVSVAIEADTEIFQHYKGGIISSDKCGTSLDHAVLIVGYGVENDQMYWLVKNSWGTTWGDNGYVKIQRSDSDKDAGICGIAMQPSYPVF